MITPIIGGPLSKDGHGGDRGSNLYNFSSPGPACLPFGVFFLGWKFWTLSHRVPSNHETNERQRRFSMVMYHNNINELFAVRRVVERRARGHGAMFSIRHRINFRRTHSAVSGACNIAFPVKPPSPPAPAASRVISLGETSNG